MSSTPLSAVSLTTDKLPKNFSSLQYPGLMSQYLGAWSNHSTSSPSNPKMWNNNHVLLSTSEARLSRDLSSDQNISWWTFCFGRSQTVGTVGK